MLSYLNYFLLAVLVVFSVAQLKHDGKVTQKHFTGDWRQRLHEIFTDEHFDFLLLCGLSFILSIINITCLFLDNPSLFHYRDESILFALIWYTITLLIMCAFLLFLWFVYGIIIFLICFTIWDPILHPILRTLIDFIYFNPKGKYILEKDKLSGKYDIFECGEYPGGRNKIKIPQLIGQNNNLAFANKGEIFKQIFKRNDCGIIIASFSEKTLSEYEKWLICNKE